MLLTHLSIILSIGPFYYFLSSQHPCNPLTEYLIIFLVRVLLLWNSVNHVVLSFQNEYPNNTWKTNFCIIKFKG